MNKECSTCILCVLSNAYCKQRVRLETACNIVRKLPQGKTSSDPLQLAGLQPVSSCQLPATSTFPAHVLLSCPPHHYRAASALSYIHSLQVLLLCSLIPRLLQHAETATDWTQAQRHQDPICGVLHDDLQDTGLENCLFSSSLTHEPVIGSPNALTCCCVIFRNPCSHFSTQKLSETVFEWKSEKLDPWCKALGRLDQTVPVAVIGVAVNSPRSACSVACPSCPAPPASGFPPLTGRLPRGPSLLPAGEARQCWDPLAAPGRVGRRRPEAAQGSCIYEHRGGKIACQTISGHRRLGLAEPLVMNLSWTAGKSSEQATTTKRASWPCHARIAAAVRVLGCIQAHRRSPGGTQMVQANTGGTQAVHRRLSAT